MVNNMKKAIIISLVLAMVTSQMVGCSSEKASTKPTDGSATSQTGESSPVEIEYMGAIWGAHPQDGNPIFDAMMAEGNADIDFNWYPSANYANKVGALFSSLDTMPDVISSGNVAALIDQGALLPLDDLLAEHGKNILAAIGEDNMKYVRQATDGKIYHIPNIADASTIDYKPAYATVLREDWLTNVGIDKAPETWEEWKEMWYAFKEQDANLDGDPTNEIPWAGDIYSLMPAFGINVSNKMAFTIDDNNNYTLAYELPEFREYLTEMQILYKDGIIDKEFTTRGSLINAVELEKPFHANLAGSSVSWAAITQGTTDVLVEVHPDAKLIGVKPIVSPNGDSGVARTNIVSGSTAITVAAEDKAVEIIQFFDWLYSPEGATIMSFGVEGVHHEVVDGKKVLMAPYNTGFIEARDIGLNYTPFPHIFLGEAREQLIMSGKGVDELAPTAKLFYDASRIGSDFSFQPVPTISSEAYVEKQAQIFPKIEQLLASAVVGTLSVDEFYTEYEKLKPIGLEDILTQGNEAWQKLSQ